jgi:hypothetical protein
MITLISIVGGLIFPLALTLLIGAVAIPRARSQRVTRDGGIDSLAAVAVTRSAQRQASRNAGNAVA